MSRLSRKFILCAGTDNVHMQDLNESVS
jgi:hypothetical protein